MGGADEEGETGAVRIQSVARACQALLAIARSDDGLSAREVSESLGLTMPTTYHLLTTLRQVGFVSRSGKHHTLGPAMQFISSRMAAGGRTPPAFSKALGQVIERTGETAYLCGWRNGDIAVLDVREGSQAVRVAGLTVGYSGNLHARAAGKLLLAYASEDLRERVMSTLTFERLTERTLTSRSALLRELDGIRKAGRAYDREEFQSGVHCVAVPLFVADEVVACLSVSVPSTRFAENAADIEGALEAAAQEASITV